MKLLLPIYIYRIECGTWMYKHIFRTVIVDNKLAYMSSIFKFVLKVKSLKNLAPALSSIEFSFKFRYYKLELSFKACAKYLEPSNPITLLLRFKWVNIWFFIRYFEILRAPWSPILLYERLSSTNVVFKVKPGFINLNNSSSIRFPAKLRTI